GVYFPGFAAVSDLAETDPVSGGVVIERDIPPAPVTPSNLYFDEVLRGCEVEAWRSGVSLLVRGGRGEEVAGALPALARRGDGEGVGRGGGGAGGGGDERAAGASGAGCAAHPGRGRRGGGGEGAVRSRERAQRRRDARPDRACRARPRRARPGVPGRARRLAG